MKKERIESMYAQMVPSAQAGEELAARLREAVPGKKQGPVGRYLAVAACAALLIAAYPAYRALAPKPIEPHGYVTVGGSDTDITKQMAGGVEGTDTGEGGDRDQVMTPGELTEAMEEVGFSTGDIDAYQALGYQMTWAKWWKFVDRQRNSEGEEPFNLASLEAFSREELSVNTGELPGGALAPDTGALPSDPVPGIPNQPGADAYQLLMAHFGETQPDWYGGAYVAKNGFLMVLLVNDKDPGDKSLELEVLEAAGGRTAPVAFAGAKYSRNDLERLNREIGKLLDGKGIFASWGIYDDQNRIILDFFETPPEEILTGLAGLDPDGDAVLVRVVEGGSMVTDQSMKGPPPVDPIGGEE